MFSNKLVCSEKITLVENEKIITEDLEIVKVLNDFFSNKIQTFNTRFFIRKPFLSTPQFC